MPDIWIVYSMFPTRDEAVYVARELLSARLIACANVLGGVESLYHWQGEMQHEQETLLLTKTQASHVPALIERIRALHSYELPCIVSLPVSAGLPAFLQWVETETTPTLIA